MTRHTGDTPTYDNRAECKRTQSWVGGVAMVKHAVVPHDEWIEARKRLLAREKEFTRLRDELNRERRELPWEPVNKDYAFEGPDGRETLADLFAGRRQLIVQHFMFDPSWSAACKSC